MKLQSINCKIKHIRCDISSIKFRMKSLQKTKTELSTFDFFFFFFFALMCSCFCVVGCFEKGELLMIKIETNAYLLGLDNHLS